MKDCQISEIISGPEGGPKLLIFEALHRISDKMPVKNCYHTFEHTAEVISYARLFAQADNRSDREVLLITYAATFHDIGYLLEPDNHEELGSELASALLLDQGSFSTYECDLVKQMILDTRVRTPHGWCFGNISNELSAYLCDADVSNFGRTTFLQKAELVRSELGLELRQEYYHGLLEMLDAHSWHSNYAKNHFEEQKKNNRRKVVELIDYPTTALEGSFIARS